MITVALVGWPIIMIILARTLPWQNAVIASLIGGYLLLPTQGGFDLPLLPPVEKDTLPSLVMFILALTMGPAASTHRTSETYSVQKGWLPKSAVGRVLLFMFVVGMLLTAITNSDPIRFSETAYFVPGLSLHDGFSVVVRSVGMIVPILLGRKYLGDPQGHRMLLIGLVVAGLGYSLLALIEARLSPQMNNWVYGFFPHQWAQHVRDGGFRPLVFLEHGLLLAIFFAMTILAAIGLYRSETQKRGRWLLAAAWLFGTLVLCNTTGALLIVLVLAPIVFLLKTRAQILIASLIAMLVLSYPLVRGANLVPTNSILAMIEPFSDQRMRSLRFRFENEDALLERANERPLFGWGSFGRNRVYDEGGRDQSTVDGAWIFAIGQGGWVGYIAEFGLLSIPLILFALGRRRYDLDQATAVLCLVLAANMIDMLPNAGRSPITWLIVGAILGRLEIGRMALPAAAGSEPVLAKKKRRQLALARKQTSPETRQASPYTRQPKHHARKNSGLKS